MSRFQQGSLLKQKRKCGPDVWVFRWYDESSGKRTYEKRNLGTVKDGIVQLASGNLTRVS